MIRSGLSQRRNKGARRSIEAARNGWRERLPTNFEDEDVDKLSNGSETSDATEERTLLEVAMDSIEKIGSGPRNYPKAY